MKWSRVQGLINDSLEKGFPGGQLLVEKSGQIIFEDHFGSTMLEKCTINDERMKVVRGESVTPATLFDTASLTKVFAVTYLFQRYLQQDSQILEKRIGQIFQNMALFQDEEIPEKVANITIKALLSHHAGFEPNPLFYDPQYSQELYCQTRSLFAKFLLKAPLVNEPES